MQLVSELNVVECCSNILPTIYQHSTNILPKTYLYWP